MFTGIIEAMAKVLAQGDGRLMLERPAMFDDLKTGSSIAVSGVCLTVTEMNPTSLTFDVMPETISKTTIGNLAAGDFVNLERALPAHGRFEGHVVQGHSEGTGEIVGLTPIPVSFAHNLHLPAPSSTLQLRSGSAREEGESTLNSQTTTNSTHSPSLVERGLGREVKSQDVRLTVRVPAELKRVIVPKGSICLDGVSLTVADTGADTCTVALIPTTLTGTTLGRKRMGERVNIETDILVRTLLASR
ncbi:MAG: riboflavin synthase [Candidatus Peribacteraceae bacterium]|nr:riboflavin synthase [Candidatus Peribacteraceae bacterium]MDD5742879.1 riboflavin synthase [Candidatus Peribacteraceae bacterium]